MGGRVDSDLGQKVEGSLDPGQLLLSLLIRPASWGMRRYILLDQITFVIYLLLITLIIMNVKKKVLRYLELT